MIRPATYAALLKVALLVAGVGRLAYTAANGQRLDVLLADCAVTAERQPPPPAGTGQWSCEWKGCDTLAREVGTSAALLLAGGVPLKRPDRDDG